MAVPDFQSLTLPVLKEFADGIDHATEDIRARVAERLKLTPEEIAEVLPSGGQTRFANRVAWAHVYMKQAGLLFSERRGIYRITPRGREVLAAPPDQINMAFLENYPEYRFKESEWGANGLPIIRIQDLKDVRVPFNRYSGIYDPRHFTDVGPLLIACVDFRSLCPILQQLLSNYRGAPRLLSFLAEY